MANGVLEGRKAIVTGASRGIGEAIALTFARAGAEIVLAARSRKDLDRVAAEIARIGAKAHIVETDMGELDQVRRLAKSSIEKTGGIDIIVSNAGISGNPAPILDTPAEEWSKVYQINYLGPLTLIQALGKQLDPKRGANIVIVSSLRGLGGTPFGEPYGAAKAALNHLTRTLACELGPSGIRVNAVLPGPVETDMVLGYLSGNQRLMDHFGNLAPLKGWPQSQDIADPTLFLASHAARRITGHLLVVDSGLSAINQDAFGPPES